MAIIDDEPAVRLLVRMLLDGSERFEFVGEADHLEDGIELTERTQPDVVLVDLLMPATETTSSLDAVAAAAPQAMILVLSALSPTDAASGAFDAGAFAYLEKSVLGPGLLEEMADLSELFGQHRTGIDVWASPDGPSRIRS